MEKERLEAALFLWRSTLQTSNRSVYDRWPRICEERTERRRGSGARRGGARSKLGIFSSKHRLKERPRVEHAPALGEGPREEQAPLLPEAGARALLRVEEQLYQARPRRSGAPQAVERAIPFRERERPCERDLFEEPEERLWEARERRAGALEEVSERSRSSLTPPEGHLELSDQRWAERFLARRGQRRCPRRASEEGWGERKNEKSRADDPDSPAHAPRSARLERTPP